MRLRTPTTKAARERAAQQPALDAVLNAWTQPGPRPAWHQARQDDVRAAMPLLADALDRLAKEHP